MGIDSGSKGFRCVDVTVRTGGFATALNGLDPRESCCELSKCEAAGVGGRYFAVYYPNQPSLPSCTPR